MASAGKNSNHNVRSDQNRTAADLLPEFFRSDANSKFIQGTIDQLIKPGEVDQLDGFVGRKTTKSFSPGDNYLQEITPERVNYQLETASVITDDSDNVTFYKDYNDYINTLRFLGANVLNHSRLNSQETYAWDPHINWDKFTNFREYYWLPNGPQPVEVKGEQRDVVSTYTVTTVTDDDNTAFVFNSNGERNPTLELYKGQTYRFEIDTPGHPIAFAVSRSFTPGTAIITAGREGIRGSGLFDSVLYGNNYDQGDFIVVPRRGSVEVTDSGENNSTLYPDGIRKVDNEGDELATVYVESGIIEFTVPYNAPEKLYYISKNNIDTSGMFIVNDIEENTFIDVEKDIIGKRRYQTASGVSLSNGMKIKLIGNVSPLKYANDYWIVEGVGTRNGITLIRDSDLIIPAAYSTSKPVNFDSDEFDTLPFANANNYANKKDYIVINRSANDRNAWSRYNRWIHRDVIEESLRINGLPVNVDESARAKRPIIEFEAGLKLKDYGTFSKNDVDLVDTFTKDVFSTIEGTIGYNVDGIDLTEGMRVLFTADTDILVNGKIYEVKFVTVNNKEHISLVETEDATPLENEVVFVTQGNEYAGRAFYFNGDIWLSGQHKISENQPPLFELFSPNGDSYVDDTVFESSTFKGTKIFSYAIGSGVNDNELGFPLSYRNIENSGDILFNFDLLNETFTHQVDDSTIAVDSSTASLKKYKSRGQFTWVNGWSSVPKQSLQYVHRQYIATDNNRSTFEIDVYDNASKIKDLKVIVYVNSDLKFKTKDYEINRINDKVLVTFNNSLDVNDVVLIKTASSAPKNNNGFYEVPHNLERNPLNEDISDFTLGEVIDHVDSMIEDLPGFNGKFPGRSNLRDLGNVDKFGKKFVKHTGPVNNPLYHITSKDYNIVKALDFSNNEYNKFKRVFVEVAESLGFDGDVDVHCNKVLEELNKDKVKSQPFYFSDMLGYKNAKITTYTVLDSRITQYPLPSNFDLTELSSNSVIIYLNNRQLVAGREYDFSKDGFVNIRANQRENDLIKLDVYESTNGSFVPPTPTKLGLYPKFEPGLILDDTYLTDTASYDQPYKVYGEVVRHNEIGTRRGWFYPAYKSKMSAKQKDKDSGGTGDVHSVVFNGNNIPLYIPSSDISVFGGQDNIEYDIYPECIAFVKGHDGSKVRAYQDFRDSLLLEYETRVYNNIKVQWDSSITDVHGFVGGDFRQNEFSTEEVTKSLKTDFIQWLSLVDNDYTDNYFYNRLNDFTYNYSMSVTPSGDRASGFWRGIYIRAFDTDTPHSTPWEMLGFLIKPSWWDQVYGPSPYTSDNLILWEDIENGVVREPGKQKRVLEKYKRPGLSEFLPVDQQGNLLSPLNSGYVKSFVVRQSANSFKFGDNAPVETAWRKSSHYPFTIVKSMLLNKPAHVFNTGFDVSRNSTNLAGQRVYSETGKHMSVRDIVFPNSYADSNKILTSGFVNYIYNLVASDILSVYSDYKNQLTRIQHKLGFKLAGFSDKQKLNLLLESRSPASDSNTTNFLPSENYQVILNTSSPIDSVKYSGVVVEKTISGFLVRGYNNSSASFEYYKPLSGTKRIPTTVGGISEVSSEWNSGTIYNKDQVVDHNNSYYRVTKTFTSGTEFDTKNLALLPELPIVGGKTATTPKEFNKDVVKELVYGSILKTSQEVVDFISGYGAYLKDQGFEFEFVEEDGTVSNWSQVAKDFLFWTTQGWAEGTVITLSPSAHRLDFSREYAVVDDIYDTFYDYSLFTSNGTPLNRDFNNLYRSENSFSIATPDTDEGIYSITLPIVQKEHVVILDNTSIFNDIIYQPRSGYRRERIKLSGYKSANWNGGLNISGFIFDDVTVTDWEEWQDYSIGAVVKFKQYYYTAKMNVQGSNSFDENKWTKLNSKPESELIANFDYKISQFSDFYDTDTNAFNSDLQGLAHHLIGFQKRDYLANIINNEVSQYKFYQGMIQEKGTTNVLNKMFESLENNNKETLEFYEDWALRVGQFGSVDAIKKVEINLDERKMIDSPQPIEFVSTRPSENFDKVYRILPNEMHEVPVEYNHAPFVTKLPTEDFVKTSGFVNDDDVTYVATSVSDLNSGDVNMLALGDYIWVTGQRSEDWNVFQHVSTGVFVNQLDNEGKIISNGVSLVKLTTDKWIYNLISVDDYVGVRDAQDYNLVNIYKVNSVSLNYFEVEVPDDNDMTPFTGQSFLLTKLRSVRLSGVNDINRVLDDRSYDNQKLWIDNFNDDWAVLENNSVYNEGLSVSNTFDMDSTVHDYGKSIDTTTDNRNLIVSAPGIRNGVVLNYQRPSDTSSLRLVQEIELTPSGFDTEWKPNTRYKKSDRVYVISGSEITFWVSAEAHTSGSSFNDTKWIQVNDSSRKLTPVGTGFGDSISVSEDGEYLAVGMPTASDVKTRFKGEYTKTSSYNKNDIVKHQESLWKANKTISKEIEQQEYNTFNSYVSLYDDNNDSDMSLLVMGDPGLPGNKVNHLLVKAPVDMYLGTKTNNSSIQYDLKLFWNKRSYAFPELKEYLPFSNTVGHAIDADFLKETHRIIANIDYVFFINTYISLPSKGDTITTETGKATVYYSSTRRDSAVIYAVDTNGYFENTGEMYVNDVNLVGTYKTINYNDPANLGGFWLIETNNEYQSQPTYVDNGQGLVYADVRPNNSSRPFNVYYNIQDALTTIGDYIQAKNRASFITQLSYYGDPTSSDTETSTLRTIPSNLWVVRVGKDMSDDIIDNFVSAGSDNNPEYDFRVFRSDNRIVDLQSNGLSYQLTNQTHQVYDLWDGYIDFEFTNFDFNGVPYQPQVGDIIEDVQIPSDGSGGLALTSQTTSSAEVVYIQRNFNLVRVYIKNRKGPWTVLNNIQRFDIRRKASILRGDDDVDRVVGTVNDTGNDIVIDTGIIGKFVVFKANTEFRDSRAWHDVTPIVDEEYVFYTRNIEKGESREASVPHSGNKDYSQVYHISADSFGTPGPDKEGAVALYRKINNANYELIDIIVSEYRNSNRQFGSTVKITKNKNQYALFVKSLNNSDIHLNGTIEVFYNGTNENFKGAVKDIEYKQNDVVVYKGEFYKANANISEYVDVENSIYWSNISWSRGTDDKYRGDWSADGVYSVGDIVRYDSKVYVANTNIVNEAVFDTSASWTVVPNELVDYTGYLPNVDNLISLHQEEYSTVTKLNNFSNTFDTSENGSVFVTVASFAHSDSTVRKYALVYRLYSNTYILDQVINQNSLTSSWGEVISVSPSGDTVVISDELSDINKTNQGCVYVYRMHNGQYEFFQNITPPNNEETERFGYYLDVSDDVLAVSSLNGDKTSPTTFDGQSTTFDDQFTLFKNIHYDTGVVYVFENIGNQYVHSEEIKTNVAEHYVSRFGETVKVNKHHVYVSAPSYFNKQQTYGIVFDSFKPKNTYAWNILRSGVRPVDLNLIEGAYLYNKRTNKVVSYIDYIDPVQGKIPGTVEQELTYKMEFDPASYNVGKLNDVNVNQGIFWGEDHVGQAWWNISSARFVYPYQGDIAFQKHGWCSLSPGSNVEICEWVRSDYSPVEWDELADTQDGVVLGISGKSLYGNEKYSSTLEYDQKSQTFRTLYYFWVKDKTTIPTNRTMSIVEMAKLISRPREQGYRFISFLTSNKIVLNNFENLANTDDLVLSIQYKTSNTAQTDVKVHNQYQLLSDGFKHSKPNADIEEKWFDSLIGVDRSGEKVPDPRISTSKQVGVLNKPRQTMFVNRVEALKQVIERINAVFEKNIIVDQYNITKLYSTDEMPFNGQGAFDDEVDILEDLQLVGTNKIKKAKLEPVIVNGKIVRVKIVDSGRGYRVPPTVIVNGSGKSAEISTDINNLGQVVSVTIQDQGTNYGERTILEIRPFTVLVKADSSLGGKWALYSWNNSSREWFRTQMQSFDVRRYWKFVDWFADGYNQFTNVDHVISGTYLLPSLNNKIGSIVRVENVGAGGWLLLEKVSNKPLNDFTTNYKTVGKENGTIQLLDSLYDLSKSNTGFDNQSFDSRLYDVNPSLELRIIFEALRDDIFVSDLLVEYNQLFFSSLRYVLSEQHDVDWLFKTSYINVKHDLGNLEQRSTYARDKSASFEEFVSEVKPYKTKIREFVGTHSVLDDTNSNVLDFDSPANYSAGQKKIVTNNAVVDNGVIIDNDLDNYNFEDQQWYTANGYRVVRIDIDNPGSGYTTPPNVTVNGRNGHGADAKAYIGYGKLTHIDVVSAGQGYMNSPVVSIDTPQGQDGVTATATAQIGEGLVRTPSVTIKFDRTSGLYTINKLPEVEIFAGTNVNTQFMLTWPMDVRVKNVKIEVDDEELLRSEISFKNIELDKDETGNTYTYSRGLVTFSKPPKLGAEVKISYFKSLEMLSAEDRIKYGYTPTGEMFGNKLSQLIEGIDYGGVEITSFGFDEESGWDTGEWYTGEWDSESNYEDDVFVIDNNVTTLKLSSTLETGAEYNIYRNGIRIDDSNYSNGDISNKDAETDTIVGDGSTDTIDLNNIGVSVSNGDVIIIRKSTSDGSLFVSPNSYDTAISGGGLVYNNAKGVTPEEIIIEGEGFDSLTNNKGPEELLPGNVLDTLDIKVFTRQSSGQGRISSQVLKYSPGVVYKLDATPSTEDSIIVKLDGQTMTREQFTIDWQEGTVTLNSALDGSVVNIVVQELGLNNLADFGRETVTRKRVKIPTSVRWNTDLTAHALVNGTVIDTTVVKDNNPGSVIASIRFEKPLYSGDVVQWAIFTNAERMNYSQIKKEVFMSDGITSLFNLESAPIYTQPSEYNVLVKAGDTFLRSGYNTKITATKDQTEFKLEKFQKPVGSVQVSDIRVFLNDKEIFTPGEWRLEISSSSIILSNNIIEEGDVVSIYVVADSEYIIEDNRLTLRSVPLEGTEIEVYQFSNHDILNIEKINYDVISRVQQTGNNVDYITYNRLTVGEVKLRHPAESTQYVWVLLNGKLLTPNVEYTLNESKDRVEIFNTVEQSDVIEVVHFAAPVSQDSFAFRQFKDILNRTHFKRINRYAATLVKPLNYYDLRIEVDDTTHLPEPSKSSNRPGIIWVNGERIEYFVKDKNMLRQLRRGTLGTGIPELHDAGQLVYDQGYTNTIPYHDNMLTQKFVADGTTQSFTVDFSINTVNDIEVFVAGKRLRKTSIMSFDANKALTSPDGDIELPAEFSINGNSVEIHNTLNDGDHITIIKRVGKVWTDPGSGLSEMNNSISKFIQFGNPAVPE